MPTNDTSSLQAILSYIDGVIKGDTKFSFIDAELKVLDFWEQGDTFQASLRQTEGRPPYIFYDGPPFATGLPHHGHFAASTIKDVVPRYWTMRGYHVNRKFGWDCHGLPIEHEIDKQLGMSTDEALDKHGIEGYNNACRDIVQRYAFEWRKSVTRLGRWVDFDDDYKTMDSWFMESVWWVFKSLWDKDLIYKGTKVMPVSTELRTVLSNFEANSNYLDTQDPAITVLFKLTDEDAYLATWTTTPWTLPSNLAVCAGPDVDYVKVVDAKLKIAIYLAEALLPEFEKRHELEVVAKCQGRDLLGRHYEPLFPYFQDLAKDGVFCVLNDDFVSTKEGTGLVHMAPAFGEDDHRIFLDNGLTSLVCPVTMNGTFTDEVSDFAGRQVHEAGPDIIRKLDAQNSIYEAGVIEHAYPFCYRSDTRLIYRIIESWYVKVSTIKDRIIKANEKVRWVPSHIKSGRFGNWLQDARDWAVSRNRVWGTPLPIWINDESGKTACFGSIDELANASGTRVVDLHREHVDTITFSRGGEPGTYRRIPEVLDCWFESGSMPYAHLHYPFANKDVFDAGFPAEFIAEGLDQTRGWFYTLMVISTALFDEPAFKNVIVNGMVMAEDGKKMSKRLRNYTPPDELMERFGADALRLYLISSPLMKGESLKFTDKGVREMLRRSLLPWFNAFKFLSTYAKIDGWSPTQEPTDTAAMTILDRWILSRLQTLKRTIKDEMEAYLLFNVTPVLFDFIEELTNWYIRLNRARFWGEGLSNDKRTAYASLYQTLSELSLIMAPFAPFFAETLYQHLTHLNTHNTTADKTGIPSSVHLCVYPEPDEAMVDKTLEAAVRSMQALITLGRRKREQNSIPLRTPLPQLTIIHNDPAQLVEIERLEPIFKQELNVKAVRYTDNEEDYINMSAKPNFAVLGKRLGARMRDFHKAIGELDKASIQAFLDSGKIEIQGESFSTDDIITVRQPRDGVDCLTDQHITLQLDCLLTDALIAEGQARELVHHIQNARQTAGYHVADRIHLVYDGDAAMLDVIANHIDYIQSETLALSAKVTDLDDQSGTFQHVINDLKVRFRIDRA